MKTVSGHHQHSRKKLTGTRPTADYNDRSLGPILYLNIPKELWELEKVSTIKKMTIPANVSTEMAKIGKTKCKSLKRYLKAQGRRIEAVEVTWRPDGQIGGFRIINKRKTSANEGRDENRDPLKMTIRKNSILTEYS
jgi:hypothetical protein